MISVEAAALAISVARGTIKLAGRLDHLLAEKEAIAGNLLIPMPPESEGPDRETRIALLRQYLKDTPRATPDPLGDDRKVLQNLLSKDPVPDESDRYFERLFPEQAAPAIISPDAEYLAALRRYLPTANWDEKTNQDMLKAAFYIAAGRDERGVSYPARIGLLVADVLAEFGAENTALFVRDENAQTILKSVLENFARPELEEFEDWSPLLRHALGATLNGLLDSRTVLASHAKWVDALLRALASARANAPDPDNYLVGLLSGSSYNLLLGEGMKVASEKLAPAHAAVLKDIAAVFLVEAAPLVQANKRNFGDFFKEHWGDLLRGSLSAATRHGPGLWAGQSPLLQQTLLALMNQLSAVPGTDYFTKDTAFELAEVAISAVAKDPKLLQEAAGNKWMRELIGSFTATISDSSLRESFSNAALERIFAKTLKTLAQNPDLIVGQPGLTRDTVGQILSAVAASDNLAAESLAETAVTAAFGTLTNHPDLAATKLGPYLGEVAGLLSKKVAEKGLTSLQAAEMFPAVTDAMLRNPRLFAELDENLSATVLEAVINATDKTQFTSAAGLTLVDVAHEVFASVARHGASFVAKNGTRKLGTTLTDALTAGLTLADEELGRLFDKSDLPLVIGGIVRTLLLGNRVELNPKSKNFKKLFTELADAVTT